MGLPFQAQALKILVEDPSFSRALADHVSPAFFQHPSMAWAWSAVREYRKTYRNAPSWAWLFDAARRLPGAESQERLAVLDHVWRQPITDEEWLRRSVIDYVKRSIFKAAMVDAKDLFVVGKYDEAYDMMQQRIGEIRITAETVDRGWISEDFTARVASRADPTSRVSLVGTGIMPLDQILEGGAYPGFLGTWIAYPKAGKTTTLVNLGAATMALFGRRMLHVVLEGSRPMVEARYDAIFTQELYSHVKRGQIDAGRYQAAVVEMQRLKSLGVIRGYTENWDTSVLHIEAELASLKHQYGWEPDVIVVDYADLLRARTPQASETHEQIQAYKDLKKLAERGYRIWTASQAQRPNREDWDVTPHEITSNSIADAYGKVRICDFIGSINMTTAEKQQGITRYYCEMFRDGACNLLIEAQSDFSRMTISGAQARVIERSMAGKATQAQGRGASLVPGSPGAWTQTTTGIR